MLRGNNQYYAKSEKCFRLARYYRDEYPWASAHLGAMLINKRRYNETKSTVSEAYQLLEQALKRHGYRYGWALFYQGGARFLTIATNLIDEINRGQLPPNGEDSSEYQGLLMGYSMVIALTDDASSFFSHPFHPGAIGSDEYLTLCYDLLDFLPTLDRQGTTKEAYLAYLKILIDAMVAGFNFMRTDEFVPGSETIRFLYAYLYVFFLAENAAANVGNDPATWRRTLVPLFQKGYQQLDLSVDLRRVAPSSSAAAGQATAFSGNPMDIVDLLNSLLTNLATTSIPRLQSAQLELQREGVLLRLFDLMMIAAKLGVIEKVWGRPTKDTELVVDQLEKVIPVLKLAGGRQTIDEVHRLVTKADDGWLLTPQWVPDLEPKRRKALEAFLKVTNMKEPIMEDSLMGGAV
jgi:hypothetical protein